MKYELRTEYYEGVAIVSAHTLDGHYIGSEENAKFLCDEMGIAPELSKPDHKVCSIGFSEKDQKWYGWSHRAYCGFTIGSEVKKGDCAYEPDNRENFAEDVLNFWKNEEYHEWTKVLPYTNESGMEGVELCFKYNNEVPNERLRGTIKRTFHEYPITWGRGEWEALTLEDAKQMAKDFAEDVS